MYHSYFYISMKSWKESQKYKKKISFKIYKYPTLQTYRSPLKCRLNFEVEKHFKILLKIYVISKYQFCHISIALMIE